MEQSLFWSEVQMIIVFIISVMLTYEFFLAKNGILRKLMIIFFAVESLIYLSIGVFIYLQKVYDIQMSMGEFRTYLLIPKSLIMLRILYYLSNQK